LHERWPHGWRTRCTPRAPPQIDELLKTTELELAVTLLQPTSQALLNLAKLANARYG